MDEITVRIDGTLFSFDGRVLETFGTDHQAQRWHIKHLYIEVTGPDRKGRMNVKLWAGSREDRAGYSSRTYEAAEWATLAPFLRVVQSALDPDAPPAF